MPKMACIIKICKFPDLDVGTLYPVLNKQIHVNSFIFMCILDNYSTHLSCLKYKCHTLQVSSKA